ncbi:hypothetical protein ACFWZT_02440 [Streptomyces alboflavus]|uniref:hypothetical protein n=1 Tax=Streptomyces alboflavus TaxID=67267 RepID=UPI00368E9BC9
MSSPVIAPCLGVTDTDVTVAFYEKLGFTALPGNDDPDGYVIGVNQRQEGE